MTSAVAGPRAGESPSPRRLRAQVREWRRGRVDTSWVEALQDAYTAVFSAVLIGAMAGNVVLNVRRNVTDSCVAAACLDGRVAAPWFACLAATAVCAALARLAGPVSVTPAVASWLLPAPVDRAALLRVSLVRALLLAPVLAGAVAALVGLLSGLPGSTTLGLGLATAGLAAAVVGGCAWAQGRHDRVSGLLAVVLGGAAWVVLLLVATGVSLPPPGGVTAGALVVVVALAGTAGVVGVVAGWRALPAVPGRSVASSGTLAPSLSGALASLDLALVWDILHARAWRARGTVPPLRARPARRWAGPRGLVGRDLARLRRRPALLLGLAAALVLPYALEAVHAGRLVVLAGALAGLVAGAGLFAGLRVLSRTPHLARCLPLSPRELAWSCTVVPGLVLLLWGLLTAPALRDLAAPGSPASLPVLMGLVVGLAALAGCVRWMTGRPPDYRMPLVSSPAGAIPTSLIGSAVRGLDLVLVVTAPVLLLPTVAGAQLSIVVGVLAVWFLLERASSP